MKIRSLKLTNVRKFGGRVAELTGIGDGLTVVSEANEFGKSTFFDALHALFFEKHGSTAKTVKSLQPRPGGGVAIAAEVETAEGRYLVEKHFISQKGASVRDLDRGSVIARDGEAEDWIARLIGEAEQGPAGLLWVRQGVLGLEPADGSSRDRERLVAARRDLMSSVAGEIDQVTGGRRMDRILARCQQELGQITTAKGRPSGAWKEAVDRVEILERDLIDLTRLCAELSDALTDRRGIDGELRRIDDPEAKAALERGLAGAQRRLDEAKAHAERVSSAEQALRIAALERDGAVAGRDALVAAEAALAEAAKRLSSCETVHHDAVVRSEAGQSEETKLRSALETVATRISELRQELRAAEERDAARKAKAEAARLEKQLQTARGHHEAAIGAEALVRGNPVTQAVLAAAEDAAAETARVEAALLARTASMTVRYDGKARLSLDGTEVEGDRRLQLGEKAEIEMPGIGKMRLDLPASGDADALQTRMEKSRATERAALAACGAATLDEARRRARERQETENACKLAVESLSIAAPDGIGALEAALATAEAWGKSGEGMEGRSTDDIKADIARAEDTETAARTAHERSRKVAEDTRAAVIRAEAALETARIERDGAETAAGPAESRDERRKAAEKGAADKTGIVENAQAALASLKADAPDLKTAEADHKRAADAVAGAAKRRSELTVRRAELSARIETRADESVETRRDEVAGEIEALRERLAHFERERDTLVRLRDALAKAREEAREAYFGPIQEELAPLLGILHDDAGIDWESDTIMPGALRRGGEIEAFETLSGGTQEQIAILTRLAFARLFARRGQHVPIILDDALVYSDDDRIVKMFTALNRVAMDQQIIVFSCRQLAFASLGGERPSIALREVA